MKKRTTARALSAEALARTSLFSFAVPFRDLLPIEICIFVKIRRVMKTYLRTSLFAAVFAVAMASSARGQEQPYVIEYYYKTKWGFAEEFLQLFKKNHLPVLKKQIESGRILNVKVEKPR